MGHTGPVAACDTPCHPQPAPTIPVGWLEDVAPVVQAPPVEAGIEGLWFLLPVVCSPGGEQSRLWLSLGPGATRDGPMGAGMSPHGAGYASTPQTLTC